MSSRSAPETSASSATQSGNGGPSPDVQVLLVDDEPRNLDVLESVLESQDYRLVRANSADGALLALIDGEFAAIVLDVQMPGMNGLELAHLIKRRKRTQDIPIIFLTAYFPEEKFVLEGYNLGAVDYLTKPINPQILRSKVAVFVDLVRKTRALAAMNQNLGAEVDQRRSAEEALRQVNSELEQRVEARTRELTRANAELRESEGRFRLLADTAPVLIWMDGPNGCEFANRAYLEFHGRPVDELVGYRWTRFIHGDDSEAYVTAYRTTADAQQPFVGEARQRRADGQWRWLLSHVVPRFTADGIYLGRVGCSTDVTALKEFGTELQRARDDAIAASRAKDDFLAALSHELRTPLNPVLLIASDAATNPDLPEGIRADFASIRKNVEIEAGLIDDLLDLTRITRGKLAFDARPLDVHAILRDALQAVHAEIERKQLSLEMSLTAARTIVTGDPVRLQQVFWNILRNSAKFTAVNGRIRVSTAETSQHIVVTVADSGIGMAPEELARIFDPFSQGEHAGEGGSPRFGGLGLGLSIARRLVELHGGRITAYSEGRGQGATLAVELPLNPAVESPPPAAGTVDVRLRPSGDETAGGNGARSLRVLLVEDHAATRTTLARLLSRRRHTVSSVATLAEAFAQAEAQPFDLLISDIGLPDGDGCVLMEQLARRHPTLIGIALSGYGMDEDVARSKAAGFALHFIKPIDVRALDRAIADLFPNPGA